MRAVDIIVAKRDGQSLTTEQIDFLVDGFTRGTVGDEQMAAWAMAVVLRGMDHRETADLTLAMARSGETLDLHDIAPVTVDKHSTGGIGDKTSLVLGPMLAAAGMVVAKMSGRGLGFSGGTIDKLESIPGFRAELSGDEFRDAVRQNRLVIAAQSADLAPADKRLYALRDITGTVESLPLIAASIMSKKLAAGADCIVLDVKCGAGAFMQTIDEARRLAETMVAIGTHAGRKVVAAITTMEQPLGMAIGNALEVREACDVLRGGGPADVAALCCALGGELAALAGVVPDVAAGKELMGAVLRDGLAWRSFLQFVRNQGGDASALEGDGLAHAPTVVTLVAQRGGVVAALDGAVLGLAVNALGGGRERKGDTIDPAVGLVLARKVGDAVAAGEPLLFVHASSPERAAEVLPQLAAAFTIGDAGTAPPLIYEMVR